MQHLKNVENILVLDDGKIKMRGSYDELKQQGLDFDEILKKYEGNKAINKDDDIFDDNDSDKSDDEEQKNYDRTEIINDSDRGDEDLRLPPINSVTRHLAKNLNDPNETEEPINASAKIYPIHETESNLIGTRENSKQVKMIADEDKDEGNVPLTIW